MIATRAPSAPAISAATCELVEPAMRGINVARIIVSVFSLLNDRWQALLLRSYHWIWSSTRAITKSSSVIALLRRLDYGALVILDSPGHCGSRRRPVLPRCGAGGPASYLRDAQR